MGKDARGKSTLIEYNLKENPMANYQELANLVWNVADDVLRGLFKPHEYGDITLPFLVLRRLDCILAEDDRKDKAITAYNRFKDKVSDETLPRIILNETKTNFYNTSQYNLSRLKDDPDNIRINFENYLNGFTKDVRGIIENFILDQFIDRLYSATYDSFQPWTDGSAHHNLRKISTAFLMPDSETLCNDATSSATDCAL